MENILELIMKRASLTRRRIGIGILPENLNESIKYYNQAIKYAEIIPCSSYDKLLDLLDKKEIEGIVRGQLDSSYELFNKLGEKYYFKKDFRVSIIKDVNCKIFFLGPTSIRWNHCLEDKKQYISRVINHMKDFMILDDEIKIAVLLPMHQNDIIELKDSKKLLDRESIKQLKLLEQAGRDNEDLINYLTNQGYHAKNYDNRIERALDDNVNFIVPFNGIYGNAISRALWLVDRRNTEEKARLISLQLLTENYYDWVIENTASTEQDFSYHVISAVAWLNRKE